MKQTNKLTIMLLLTLVLNACSNGAIQTIEVTRVIKQTVIVIQVSQETSSPTPLVAKGGFETGTPIDLATLPTLSGVGGGGEPEPCFVKNTEPSLSFGYGIFPYQSLCLNNFPTAPNSSGITVILTDPTGHTFSESFTYNQGDILNSKGKDVGNIQEGSGIDGFPATPGVNIEIYMPASLPCGDWLVSAKTQDGSINITATILTVECRAPLISVLSELPTNPFVSPEYGWKGPTFTNNGKIYSVGTAYPPNIPIMIAFYQEDLSAGTPEVGYMVGTAKYAVSIMTDKSGNFEVPFIVSSATKRGVYYAVAAQVITPDIRLYYFGARFSII
jgi:hypothetical protein